MVSQIQIKMSIHNTNSNSNTVVNFANSLLCGVIYAKLPRQVKVYMKSLFNTTIQIIKRYTSKQL